MKYKTLFLATLTALSANAVASSLPNTDYYEVTTRGGSVINHNHSLNNVGSVDSSALIPNRIGIVNDFQNETDLIDFEARMNVLFIENSNINALPYANFRSVLSNTNAKVNFVNNGIEITSSSLKSSTTTGATITSIHTLSPIKSSTISSNFLKIGNSTLNEMGALHCIVVNSVQENETVTIDNNFLEINDSSISRNSELTDKNPFTNIYSSISTAWVNGNTIASDNDIRINKSSIKEYYVSNLKLKGDTITSKNNSVIFTDSSVKGNIVDSFIKANKTAESSQNSISIKKTSVTGDVTVSSIQSNGKIDSIISQDNSLILNDASISGTASVSQITGSANTLINKNNNIIISGANKIGHIDDFNSLELQVDSTNLNSPVLTITGTGNQTVDFTDKTIIINGVNDFNNNNNYELIEVDSNSNSKIVITEDTHFISQGLFTDEIKSGNLTLNSGDILTTDILKHLDTYNTANANANTLTASANSHLLFLNQTTRYLATQGQSILNDTITSDKWSAFGTMQGSNIRYKSQSNVDIDAMSAMVGIATKNKNLAFSAFVDFGEGSSDSNLRNASTNGDHRSYGIGISLRYQPNLPFYIDGSLRAGWSELEFDGSYTTDKASFTDEIMYTSSHIGIGHTFDLGNSTKLDLYGNYLYTYMQSVDASMDNAERSHLHFDSSDSHAFLLGTNLSQHFQNCDLNFGIAYEHNFNDTLDGIVDNAALRADDINRDIAMVNLGVRYIPSHYQNLSFSLTAQGYLFDQEGFSSSFSVGYNF